MPEPVLILASSSPRRMAILDSLGIAHTAQSADVDESPDAGESPSEMVVRLALAKARAIDAAPAALVLGADTAVVLGERIFGKPVDGEDAVRMLSELSGRTHQVMTGVAVRRDVAVWTAMSVTDVRFREIDRDEARRYWQSGEPRGKAGAYAIQGRGGTFAEAIMGSFTGVVGLPAYETLQLLGEAGLAMAQEYLDR